jgi:cephalosporin hydroxylase
VRAAGPGLAVPQPISQSFPSDQLRRALAGYEAASDISDHLSAIFFFAAAAHPRLVVELGTRGGQSTRALLAAVACTDGHVLSIDVDDCSQIDVGGNRDRWTFMQADDVQFAADFPSWCEQRGLPPVVDVLFVDTSHLLQHTRDEIAGWFPRLAADATVLFHDTNMTDPLIRLDGSQAWTWDNERGVIQAVEEHVGRRYDEHTMFADVVAGFAVFHVPYCSGLTVLSRLPSTPATPADESRPT